MLAESTAHDEEFEDVLFSSWVSLSKNFKSPDELKQSLQGRGENLIQYLPTDLPQAVRLSNLSLVVKTSVDQMVILGNKSISATEGAYQRTQPTGYFLILNEPSSPEAYREWPHNSLAELDNYIRYKQVELLLGQDNFLHVYYKGRKSFLRLVGGKYYGLGGYFNKGKKAFRRGKDLFYQHKLNKSQKSFISLMKLDLDLLIEQLELVMNPPRPKNYDVSQGLMDSMALNFTDYVLDNDSLVVLYKWGSTSVIHLDDMTESKFPLSMKSKYEYNSLAIAVPGKYFVICGNKRKDQTICFRLVSYQTGPKSSVVVEDTTLEDANNDQDEGLQIYHWGHFRRYRNSSVGIFFRPLGSVHVLAVLGPHIMHICEKGLGKPTSTLNTEPTQPGTTHSNWISMIPFSRQKKYYVFSSGMQVGVITLKLQ